MRLNERLLIIAIVLGLVAAVGISYWWWWNKGEVWQEITDRHSRKVARAQGRQSEQPTVPVPTGAELQSEMQLVTTRLPHLSPSVKPGQNPLYPLYRLRGDGGYLYTASESERDKLVAKGAQLEGELGAVLSRPTSLTVPLYHLSLKGGAVRDELYTISAEQAIKAQQDLGYDYVDIAGFVFPEAQPKSLGVYQLSKDNRHFYTASNEELEAFERDGWSLEANAFWVLETKPR